jgi:hypothetical protein
MSPDGPMAKPKLLYIPDGLFSPGFLERAGASRAFIENIGDTFDVEVYRWPWFRKKPHFTSVAAEDKRVAAMASGRHVVCEAAATALMMTALGGQQRSEVVVVAGFIPTLATLRRLGAHSLAEAYKQSLETLLKMRDTHQFVRAFIGQATPALALELTQRIDAELDWEVAQRAWPAFEGVDLVSSIRPMSGALLYLTDSTTGSDDLVPLIKRFAPHAEVGSLNPRWPTNMTNAESGHAFAQRVRQFVSRVGRGQEA